MAEQFRDARGGVVGLLESDYLRSAVADERRRLGLRCLEVGHDERDRPVARDNQQREALHRLTHEPGQVPQVGPNSNQKRLEPVRGDGLAAGRQTFGVST